MDVRRELGLNVPIALICHFNHSEAKEYREKGELAGAARYEQMLAFEDRVLEAVDRVIYVSNWARQNVENDRRVNTSSSAVIWNGVSAKPQANPARRGELGLDEDDVVLINVGSIEPRKNQVGLVDLFASIHESFPATRLMLVGDGPQRSAVEAKIKEHRLGDSVKLLGHRRDVPALLPCADCYVHYANLENCPLVLIEAARAGLPFAAVATGGVPELQDALDCKFDVDPSDIRASIERLRPLLTNPQTRREHGQRAKQAFERTFTQEAMTQAYINALSFAPSTTSA